MKYCIEANAQPYTLPNRTKPTTQAKTWQQVSLHQRKKKEPTRFEIAEIRGS